jgi:uncharacterized protein YwgA
MTDFTDDRTALIAYLAEHSPGRWIGRTALMKYCYFLQVLRNVPLRYNFSLYSYGPFDSAVLSDLGDAEALGIIQETPFLTGTGYGYKIKNVVSDGKLNELAGDLLKEHKADIDWVIQQFGTQSASDLELDSTIIYIDREASDAGLRSEELVQQVRDVKPQFAEDKIRTHLDALKDKQLLLALKS